jgi:hypothetical protein
MTKTSFVAVALFAVALAGSSAVAQDAAPSSAKPQAQTAAQKKPKVWTDDNIDSVRTPADDYQIQQQIQQQEQQQAQQAAAQKAAAQAAAVSGPTPKSVKQADSMIAAKKRDLADQQQYMQRLQKDASNPNNSDVEQMRLNWRVKSHTASEEQTQAQLKQLENERAALAKKEAEAAAKKKSSDSENSGQQ